MNRYNNPYSNRRMKAKARAMAAHKAQPRTLDASDLAMIEMVRAVAHDKQESTVFKKEKPMKEGGNAACGKEKQVYIGG